MNYPNGKKVKTQHATNKNSPQDRFSNRGMTLEKDINETNKYYLSRGLCVIHKKPTPVQIVKVDYPKRSAAVIKEAYFKQASTTDYNGLYKGRYIDFEAKETKNKTSFPLSNFHQHQIEHMEDIVRHEGICFVIIRFQVYNESYIFPAVKLFPYWHRQFKDGRKSIPYSAVKDEGTLIPAGYPALVDYLTIVDEIFF
ncbi:recombination protein U [Halolactibacillus halophilus]|uniref:Holliday junction resolvase RecU n=1 Tax=Halolactibacillus halophilus TaxID=306540 RepID=A0A1I5NT43_9BACI|nr:Holliday junction resolvase RecU [Halolactibacillus halophilus]GEM01433.1 Holliday junction resolvase RecU [Halolactibacillus halophilus]SFP24985.1 recombination protein U [Halolactibacillus halophilus]